MTQPQFGPPAYQGDSAFSTLLEVVHCPVPLHQVKTLLLGGVAATNMPRINELLDALWEEETHVFDGQEQARAFIGNLLGLLNRLTAHQTGQPYRLVSLPAPSSSADIGRYAATRWEEVQGFLRGLVLGGTDLQALSRDVRPSFEALVQGLGILRDYRELAAREPEAVGESVRETADMLRQLDTVLEDSMDRVLRGQYQQRVRSLSGQMAAPAAQSRTPGRNDLCHCGSGKKYKRCCGMN